MTFGAIMKLGPKSKHPGRWVMILAISKDVKRAYFAVYPEGHPRPKPLKERGQ